MAQALHVGQQASIKKSFSSGEVEAYANLSEDRNPIHLDEKAAAESVFGRRVVHGMLVSSLFSALLGQHLPGEGTIFLGLDIQFKGPVFIGEEVTAFVKILTIREDKPIVTLRAWCENARGETVVDGQAVAKAVLQ
ncbi:MAG: enoyl-CoA hydratase [Desulfatitalea sp. BRH_c12]|nr:MAG: enoyl-CoA hydratase [Desulfatitalea sp. BRH_c12]